MKASDLKVGDKVDGWTVTEVIFNAKGQPSRYGLGVLLDPPDDVVVLLTLEADHWDTEDFDGEYFKVSKHTWFRADEEVEL